jgi:hypothetical protein
VTAADTEGSTVASFTVTVAAASGQLATRTIAATPAAQPVTYTPHLVVSPTAGPKGTPVTVNGDSFPPNRTVTVHLGSASVTARSDAFGVLTNARLTVPSMTTGTTSLTAGSAAAPFEVTSAPVKVTVYRPQVQLAPSASGVTASGHGFAPGEQVKFTVDGHGTTTAHADSAGALSGVSVPATGEGGHSVEAAGVRSLDPTSASFLVLHGASHAARPAAVHGGPPVQGSPGNPSSGGPSAPASSPSGHAAPPGTAGGAPLWWLLIGPAVLLVAVGGGVWLLRRSAR